MHKFKKNILEEHQDESKMLKKQVINEIETILYLVSLNVSENALFQVKDRLYLRGAPLEWQINIQPINPWFNKPIIIVTD